MPTRLPIFTACLLAMALCLPQVARAANSDTAIGPDVAVGTKADDAFTTGLPAASVVSLLKALYNLQKAGGAGSAVTMTDGANATLGAKADAKSTATNTTAVSIMQVLKQISFMLQNPATTPVSGALAPQMVSVSDTFNARPANTTPYAASGTWNCNLSVSAITTATPMVATLATNTLVAGDYVTLAGVTGETVANNTWKVGSPDGTHITLLNPDGSNSVGVGTFGGTVTCSQLLVFHVGRIASGTGYITKVRMNTNSATTLAGQFRVYFYTNTNAANTNPQPQALVDQAQYPLLWANRAFRVGSVDFVLQTEGTGSDMALSTVSNLNIPFVSDPSGNIYARVAAEAAYVPISGQLMFFEVSADQN